MVPQVWTLSCWQVGLESPASSEMWLEVMLPAVAAGGRASLRRLTAQGSPLQPRREMDWPGAGGVAWGNLGPGLLSGAPKRGMWVVGEGQLPAEV